MPPEYAYSGGSLLSLLSSQLLFSIPLGINRDRQSRRHHGPQSRVSAVRSGPVFGTFVRTKDRTTGPVLSFLWRRTGPLQDQDRGPVSVRSGQDQSLGYGGAAEQEAE
jgi:hypothetical protein